MESDDRNGLCYLRYQSSQEAKYLPLIRDLISRGLSEPYSIYVYRYFLYQWGNLCFTVITFQSLFLPVVSDLSFPHV